MVKKTVVTCSGGMDSVGLIWQLLNDTDEEVFVQHIRHNCFYKHWESEEAAFIKCMDYMKKRCRSFTILPVMEYKADGPAEYRILPSVGGAIATHLSGADRLALAMLRTDSLNHDPKIKMKTLAAKEAFDMIVANENVKRETPIISYAKKDWFDILPLELIDLTATCKHPIFVNNEWTPCNKCNSCRRTIEARSGVEPLLESEWVKVHVKYPHDIELIGLGQKSVVMFVPTLEHDNIQYLWDLLMNTDKHVLIQPINVIEHDISTEDEKKLQDIINFLKQTARKFFVLPPVTFIINATLDSRTKELTRMFCVGNAAMVYKDQIEEVVTTYSRNQKLKQECKHMFKISTIDTFTAKDTNLVKSVVLPDDLAQLCDQQKNHK